MTDKRMNNKIEYTSPVLSLFLLCTISLVLLATCNTTEPPIDKTPPDSTVTKKIILAQKGVSATEVWLYIRTENFDTTETVTLRQNGNTIKQIFMASGDTTLYFDSLAPSTNYNYKAYLNGDTTVYGEAVIRTLDTTSHNFSYEIFTFGGQPTSFLYDVAIIDENDIWAVGEIYIYDSSGVYEKYNAIHWNGKKWELKKIYFDFQGIPSWTPLYSVHAFGANDIWFEAGIHWNGEKFETIKLNIDFPSHVNELWGTSNKDFYIVGNTGLIAHYNGEEWEKIEPDEDISEYYLSDIYGTADGEVYIVGVDDYFRKSVLIENASGKFEVFQRSDVVPENEIFNPKLYGDLVSIWIDENKTVYAAGSYLYNLKNDNWNYVNSLPANKPYRGTYAYYRGYITSIRGNASNDILISGTNNTLMHFNGKTWSQLGEPYDPNSNITWARVTIKGNVAVAVGKKGINGILIILKR